MSNFAALIDNVLENCGRVDAGSNRARVLRFLKDILKVDIPDRAGGMYANGVAYRQVGGSEYVAGGGYSWPTTLRSFNNQLLVSSDILDESRIYHHPSGFYQATSGMTEKAAFTHSNAHILVWGRNLFCRPVPTDEESAVVLLLFGTVYRNTDAIAEGTTLASLEIEELSPTLEAGATMLEAAARERADLMQTWTDVWKRRLGGLSAADMSNVRTPVLGREY